MDHPLSEDWFEPQQDCHTSSGDSSRCQSRNCYPASILMLYGQNDYRIEVLDKMLRRQASMW